MLKYMTTLIRNLIPTASSQAPVRKKKILQQEYIQCMPFSIKKVTLSLVIHTPLTRPLYMWMDRIILTYVLAFWTAILGNLP